MKPTLLGTQTTLLDSHMSRKNFNLQRPAVERLLLIAVALPPGPVKAVPLVVPLAVGTGPSGPGNGAPLPAVAGVLARTVMALRLG